MKKAVLLCSIINLILLASCASQSSNMSSSNNTITTAKTNQNQQSSTISPDIISSDMVSSKVSQVNSVLSSKTPNLAASNRTSSKNNTPNNSATNQVPQDAQKLLTELNTKKPQKIIFFDVEGKLSFRGYKNIKNISDNQLADPFKPYNQITDSDEITNFKTKLQTDKWVAKKFNLRSMPQILIYFDDEFHINLEAQTYDKKESWISINSPQGSTSFVVPNDVYSLIQTNYKE